MSPTQDHIDQNARLDRIENKLDSLSEAIISIARAEEKITMLAKYGEAQAVQILKISCLSSLFGSNLSSRNVSSCAADIWNSF